MRGISAVLASAAAIVPTLLLVSPALAAGATVQQPANDTTVASSSVPVRVAVSRDLTETVSSVVVRLSQDGASAAAGTEPAKLTCVESCSGTSTQQIWGGVTLDPRAPSPFGSSTPLANGTWFVQPSVNGARFGSGNRILVSYEGSPVSGLAAAADGADVALSWRRAPEPDISAYVVERRSTSGSWTRLARLGPNANSHRDTAPSSGDWSYRVLTERPDGKGGTYTTDSITVEVTVDDPASPGEPGGGTTGGDPSAAPDDGAASASPAPGDGSRTGDANDDTTSSTGAGSDGATTSPPRGGRSGRVAPPPSVRRSAGVDADVPSVAAPRERYFGEDDEFSDELDYSGAPVVPSEEESGPRVRGEEGERTVTAAMQEFVVGRLNTRSILIPVAAGLLFVTLGLHIYRWMQAS